MADFGFEHQLAQVAHPRRIEPPVQMVALMGGRTVLAGMRASVAVTATQLGLTVGNSLTALNVDQALDLLNNKLSQDLRL